METETETPMEHYSSPWLQIDLSLWEKITQGESIVEVKKGAVLFQQGDRISHVYIVKSGVLFQFVLSRKGSEKILAFMTTGSMCGELCLFTNQTQPYCIQALTDCALYQIPAAKFLQWLDSDLKINHLVIELLVRKIVLLGVQIPDLTFGSVYQRLAGELLHLFCMYGVPTESGEIYVDRLITQQELASRIGATRESVSRALNQMIHAGIIRRVKRYYIIRNPQELAGIYAADPESLSPADHHEGGAL